MFFTGASIPLIPGAAQQQPNFLYESGRIASEKALAMTPTMHCDSTRHVVIASTFDLLRVNSVKQSFAHKKRYHLKKRL
ncbi:MAG: hypothetical protein B6D35_14810 [Candidatus Brocadia sp. UTAMX2]|nr:MAG: hypothetical protein B6D35_14810 [Candidatus Brocadia sp. UTAMX2]